MSEPLPAGGFIRYESTSRAKDRSADHSWILYDDGRLYLAWYGEEMPSEPTVVLADAYVHELRRLLEAEDFGSQASPQVNPSLEDGMTQTVRARLGDAEHEVVYEGVASAVADRLQRVASEVPECGT